MGLTMRQRSAHGHSGGVEGVQLLCLFLGTAQAIWADRQSRHLRVLLMQAGGRPRAPLRLRWTE